MCLDLHLCGKASCQEDIEGYSVGAFSRVIRVKSDETSKYIILKKIVKKKITSCNFKTRLFTSDTNSYFQSYY